MMYGPGGGCPGGHGPGGCPGGHGPGGWHGGPHGGPWGPPPGGPWGPPPGGPWGPPPWMIPGVARRKNNNDDDYMKIVEYKGDGKKYFCTFVCDHCAKAFQVDYRVPTEVKFVSNYEMKYDNGKLIPLNKVGGCFEFTVACPECCRITSFLVDIRRIPDFVLAEFLRKTTKVEYEIAYIVDDSHCDFDISYYTKGTTVKEINEKMNNLYFDRIKIKGKEIVMNKEELNSIVKGYFGGKGKTLNFIAEQSQKEKEVSKLKKLKYMLLSNGLKGILNYSNYDKEEVNLLSR